MITDDAFQDACMMTCLQYQEIQADHPLVTAYFNSPSKGSRNNVLKRGNAVKYYMIRGNACTEKKNLLYVYVEQEYSMQGYRSQRS